MDHTAILEAARTLSPVERILLARDIAREAAMEMGAENDGYPPAITHSSTGTLIQYAPLDVLARLGTPERRVTIDGRKEWREVTIGSGRDAITFTTEHTPIVAPVVEQSAEHAS